MQSFTADQMLTLYGELQARLEDFADGFTITQVTVKQPDGTLLTFEVSLETEPAQTPGPVSRDTFANLK